MVVLKARIPFALLAGSALLLSVTGCPPTQVDPAPPPEPALLPPVASIQILPWYVSVQAGASFTLLAQLKDARGVVLSDPRVDSVSWQVTQGLAVSNGPMGNSVVINAANQVASLPTIVVVASLHGLSATNTIEVESRAPPTTAPPASSSGGSPTNTTTQPVSTPDWIRAPHVASGYPSIALVDGRSNGGLRNDSTFAFVDSREIDGFDCSAVPMCGEITIFPPTLGLMRDTVAWKTGCDYADFKGGAAGPSPGCPLPGSSAPMTPIPPRVHIPLFIWQASNSPVVDDLIVHDTAYLMSVFNQPWTGLTLDVTVKYGWAAASLEYYSSCDHPDFDITGQLADAIPVSEFRPDRITVAYVDDISNGAISGFACPYDTGEGAVILISKNGVGGSTLAHEMGHALIQWFTDPTVHVDGIPGFDESNVLWSNENGGTRSIRKHLTLGQLFQMSLRDASFVKRSPASTTKGVACPPIPGSETPCPGWAKDVVR